ncbi:hypothetical protein M0R45_025616 [Rubus argutus]|uniref:Secreted protein n=1 Tax=Rubus argutus TaxID=59490 RepID=A0AAW1WXP4_RUBAR
MRTILLVLICVVGFAFTLASLQEDAKRFIWHERHLAQVKNDPNLGAEDNSKSQSAPTTNPGSSNSPDNDDDTSPDDHRYYDGNKDGYRAHTMSKPALIPDRRFSGTPTLPP